MFDAIGYWTFVTEPCDRTTGFEVTQSEVTLYPPKGFGNLELSPKSYPAESRVDGDQLIIAFDVPGRGLQEMRFSIDSESQEIEDSEGYRYRRCDGQPVS